MKKNLLIILVFTVVNSFAQNRINYSQYMHNQGVFNPAYFDSENQLSGNLFHRNQWVGIEGSPTSTSAILNFNTAGSSGLNLNIYQDNITVFSDFNASLGYNYRIAMSKSSALSLGIKAGYGFYSANYTRLAVIDFEDPVFAADVSSQGYMNFGAGAYFESSNITAGFSFPYLINNGLPSEFDSISGDIGMKFNHSFYTLGGKFGNGQVGFYPTTLVKHVAGSPLQIDLNATFLFNEAFLPSIGYRNDNTLILSAGYIFRSGVKIIYSYDLASFSTASYSSGSHEVSIGFGTYFASNPYKKGKYLTPKQQFKKRRKK